MVHQKKDEISTATRTRMHDIPGLQERSRRIKHLKHLIGREDIVLQRHRPFHRTAHKDLLSLCATGPFGELEHVRYGGREHDDADVCGQHNDDFLPDHATLHVHIRTYAKGRKKSEKKYDTRNNSVKEEEKWSNSRSNKKH